MADNKPVLGIVLSLMSMIFFSFVYVFSKAVLQEVSLAKFGVYWFGVGMIENGIYFFAAKLHKKFLALDKKVKFIVILVSLFELIGTVLFFLAIDLYKSPAVVSFLATTIPVFVLILAFIFLKERFNAVESVGIVITILGAMFISYQSAILNEIENVNLGLIAGLLFGLIFAVNSVLLRKYSVEIHPVMITFFRVVLLFLFSLIWLKMRGEDFSISKTVLFNVLVGATFGPFLGVLANIWALRYIEATIVSTIVNAKGFLIMLIAYFYLSIIPKPYQIYGGILTVLGVIILSYGKHLKIKQLSLASEKVN